MNDDMGPILLFIALVLLVAMCMPKLWDRIDDFFDDLW